MTDTRHSTLYFCLVSLALALVTGCGDDGPSSPSSTITAPTISSPTSGTIVDSPTPTLTVGNASGATGLRYRFEVASDVGFQNVVDSADDIAEGSGGTTSWVVSQSLSDGQKFFWRARAAAGGSQGPYSVAAEFDVRGGFIAATPVNSVLVFDPLTSGSTVGEVGGGEFRPDGWRATDARSYIRYEVPTLTNGFVEFDVKGLRNPNPRSDKRNLLIMWDPTRGDYTQNPFRVHLAKFDTNLVNRWHMRLRFIANGQETNTGIDLFEWDPERTYTFRLEWGAFPDIVSSQRARVLLDGREIMVRNYDNLYRPDTHWIELGAAPRDESLEQAIYSNVTIGARQP